MGDIYSVEQNQTTMKKLIVLTFFFTFLILNSSFGQIDLGLSTGINYSNYAYKNNQLFSTSPRVGYFIEIAPSFQLSERFKVLLNSQYSVKGYNVITEGNVMESAYRFSYLDFIPEIEFKIFDFMDFGIGANYAFKIREAQRFENEVWVNTNRLGIIKSSDFGLTSKIKFTYENIFGFVRYNLGLQDVNDLVFTNEEGQVIDVEKRSRNLQIGIGYNLNLKEK